MLTGVTARLYPYKYGSGLVANGESTAKARGKGAASGRRFARTVYQRLRAGLNCVAPTALKEALRAVVLRHG